MFIKIIALFLLFLPNVSKLSFAHCLKTSRDYSMVPSENKAFAKLLKVARRVVSLCPITSYNILMQDLKRLTDSEILPIKYKQLAIKLNTCK